MIQRAISLEHRLQRETVRHAGSLARLHFYHGTMPQRCELAAAGERVEGIAATELMVRELAQGNAPLLPRGANYWRLLDNNGNVVMQGDGSGCTPD